VELLVVLVHILTAGMVDLAEMVLVVEVTLDQVVAAVEVVALLL
jgi:hypothetical protein